MVSKVELDYINQDEDGKSNTGEALKWRDLFKYKQTVAICSTRFMTVKLKQKTLTISERLSND